MRKTIIFIFLGMALIASANKKVALLEPLSGSDSNISSVEKAMVRGELRKAIVRIDDYEAISRSDIDKLLAEQDFQRTGMVREEDIHRIGAMSGADFLCVSTLNKSASQFYLEAYLVDVESGEILSPASQFGHVENGNLTGLYDICQKLVAELIGDMKTTDYTPIVEDFETNTWGWTFFSHDSRSVIVANGQLRLTNFGKTGTTQSDVNLPVDISKDFKLTLNFVIQQAEMLSSVGIKFAGGNSVTVNSGNCAYRVGDKRGTSTAIKMGLGRNRPVKIELVKKKDQVSIMVNGILLTEADCPFTTNLFSVCAGPNTLAMLMDVTINYLRK